MTSHLPSSSASAARIQSQVQGDHFVIADGQFNQWNVENSITHINAPGDAKTKAFERLQETVATAAFHNSAQRVDAPKCHPNTRTAVMERIMDWMMSRDDRDAWIMWLYGAAGAGKSAIVQSMAELCVKSGIPVASFFFFRTDPTRNNMRSLVATLAYQLARIMPACRDLIIQVIIDDPLVFDQSLQDQLESLILNPLRQIGQLTLSRASRYSPPLLILIDGLDECNDRNAQANLIRTLSDISVNKNIALIFLIASRPESHITMAFNSKKCAHLLTRLALDNDYLPDIDIRLFLDEKFAEIRDTHPLNHLLDPAWPPQSIINDIIKKSSGQFIYASVTMNYVSSPSGHPGQRLEVCRGLRPARLDTPFAQLDALYQYIFSNVQDMDATRPILAMTLYGNTKYLSFGAKGNPLVRRHDKGDLEGRLSDLSSVISCNDKGNLAGPLSDLSSMIYSNENEVKYLHASLPDFLCDPERSGEYYMDPGIWCAYLALQVFQDTKFLKDLQYLVTADLLIRADPTPELQGKLSSFLSKSALEGQPAEDARLIVLGLPSAVRAMGFKDGGRTYRRFFATLAPYVQAHLPHLYAELEHFAPVYPTVRSRLESLFPVAMENLSSSGRKKIVQKTASWGLVEHDNYMRENFRESTLS